MTERLTATGENVSALAAVATLALVAAFVLMAIGLLVYLVVRRGPTSAASDARRRHGARLGTPVALSVNTWPAGYTRAGGSHLWPSALVGPAATPTPRPRRVRKQRPARRQQRRRLSGRAAATLIHRKGPTA